MDILIVNPNSSASMTRKIADSVTPRVAAATRIRAVNPPDTPASIEGHRDEAVSTPAMLRLVAEGEAAGMDGFVIACFDDPGLGAAREIATGPVVGICEAAMHAASLIAHSFSVVTTLPRAVPIVEDLALAYGMDRRCRRVRAADIPVLALEDPGGEARERVRAEVVRALAEDRCEAVILGCAGMADLADWLTRETGVPVIDGCVAGVKLVEALVGAGLKTSKAGAYAAPIEKSFGREVA